jgi:hypothetical protein
MQFAKKVTGNKNGVEMVRKNLYTVNCKKRLPSILQKKQASCHSVENNRLPAIYAKNLPKVHFATIHPSTTVIARTKYLHALNMMRRA